MTCDGLCQRMIRSTNIARARSLFRPLVSRSVCRVGAPSPSDRQTENACLSYGVSKLHFSGNRLVKCSAAEVATSWGEVLEPMLQRSKSLDAYLGSLSEEQRRAIHDRHKVVRVVAGPGSGKTRVLTARVALLLSSGVRPEELLVLTFTRKAAKELKDRLLGVMGKDNVSLKHLWMGTFHAMANKILRNEIEHLKLGYKKNYTIYDNDDTFRVVYEILEKNLDIHVPPKEADKETKKTIRRRNSAIKRRARDSAKKLGAAILAAKDQIPDVHKLTPSQIHAKVNSMPVLKERFCSIYEAYHNAMRRKNAIDFSDMVSLAYLVLSSIPELRRKYVTKFKHILVDEAQDTDNSQYRLLKLLASAETAPTEPNTNSLFVVGDPNQAIYGFRGANMENMAYHLELHFHKQMSTQVLRDNYRSRPNILRGAEAVLHRHIESDYMYEELNPMRTGQGKMEIHHFSDEKVEASFVADKLKECHTMEGIPYSEMGVLFRTRDMARHLEQICTQKGVPYRSLAGLPFWQRREVKDVMCYLRFACNPDDEAAFERIVNTPARGIGPVAYDMLKAWVKDNTTTGFPRGLVNDLLDIEVHPKKLKSLCDNFQDDYMLNDILEDEPAKMIPEFPKTHQQMKVSKAAWRGLNAIRNIFVLLRSLAVHDSVYNVIAQGVLLGIGYKEYILDGKIGDGDPTERMANLDVVKSAAIQHSDDLKGLHFLESFAQDAVLWSEGDVDKENTDRANLATMHAAKGLEFKVVILCGMEEGMIPFSYDGEVDIDEETRLAYVAMSRAKDQLLLTLTTSRTRFSRWEEKEQSRYLKTVRLKTRTKDIIHPPPS